MSKKAKTPKVWPVEIIPIAKIHRDPRNTQQQSKRTFQGLVNNIKEFGFDEPILVFPHPEIPGDYRAVAGNHRLDAAENAGLSAVPAVVRRDWNPLTASLQGVRRNFGRGSINPGAFTRLVDELRAEYALDNMDIYSQAGFDDEEAFRTLYREQAPQVEEQEQEAAIIERVKNEDAPRVKATEDLAIVLSQLFEKYGETIAHSFIIFPLGGKTHLYVQSSNALKNILMPIVDACAQRGMDINTALTGLLQLGADCTNFLSPRSQPNAVVEEANRSLETNVADCDL